jgi:signal transduction histidine kinase
MHAITAPAAARSRLLWQGYAAAALVLGVAYFFFRSGSDAQLVIYQLLGLAAPIAIVVGVRRYRPARYHHWLLFAAGLVLWVAGDAYWDSYRWFLGQQAPYPSFADVAYLSAYPLLIGGVLVLFRGWGRPRIGDLLDGAIIAVAAAIVTAPVLLEPLIAMSSSAFEDTITIGYPVADLLMLIALVQLLFRARVPNFSLRCVMLGIVALLIADVVYSFLNLNGGYTSGMAVDAGWMANYALWGLAALHPSMAAMRSVPERREPGLSVWRVGVLVTALLAAPIALIVDAESGDGVGVPELCILVVLTLLVGARLLLLQRQRNQAQAALVVSEQEYRELFQEADRGRKALASQNDQLRELDSLKDDLLSLVSHELRTPLTSIVGYLDLVVEDETTLSEEQRHFLEVVGRNAKRLLSLVSDLLFVAQSEAGRMTLAHEPLSLRELVAQAVSAAAPTAHDRKIDLTFSCRDGGDVVGDEQRLAQVVDNLLSNALKFTPPGGSVSVTLLKDGDTVLVEVADTGFGISADEQQRLFTRFFRTQAAMKRAIQGTGLGLSIAKAIVEGHGGTISVESVEGEGATFRVALPTAAAVTAEPIEAAA